MNQLDDKIIDTGSFSYQEIQGKKTEWAPKQNPRIVTASGNVNVLDDVVRVDSTAGAVVMTLETAVGCDGRQHTFKKIDASANAMTIDGFGSETIDGAANLSTTVRYTTCVIKSNGTNWDLISSAVTFTPTVPKQTVYTSGSGTHTNTGSPTYIMLEMIGGGGGGGGSGTAGGTAGGDGGDSTFSTLTAGKGFGGSLGTGVAAGVGGNGGTNSGSPQVDIAGAKGDGQTSTLFSGCRGGGSFYGDGAAPPLAGGAGTAATPKGAGGAGAGGTAGVVNAGGGGGAASYLRHQITTPAASYSYAVGAAGAAGTAGTAGFNGGAGVIGLIIVTEYYQ